MSHHFTVRTTLVHHSFGLVCAQTQPHQRQKRENPTTQPDLDPTYPAPTRPDPTPYPHRHPIAMSLPPVTAVEDHRRAPASTKNSLPTPKNRCKSVTTTRPTSKFFHPTSPDLRLLHPTSPDMTRHFPPTTSHQFTVRTTLVYGWPQSLHLLRAQTRPNRPKKRKPPVKVRRTPSYSVEIRPTPRPPTPKFVHNPHPSCKLPPAPPHSVIQFTRTVPYTTLQPFSPAQE